MRHLALFALTACWTPAAPAPQPPAPPAARCEIRDANIQTADPVRLMAGGIAFATIRRELSRLDVVITGRRAQVQLETAELELFSDLNLAGFSLRTRTPAPYDGWLTIRTASVRREQHGVLAAAVPLPAGVLPRVVVASLPCTDLTFAEPPDREDDTSAGAWLAFEPGTRTPVATRPGGSAVVHLSPGAGGPLRVRWLERQGAFARIELSADNTITGWVPTEHAREVPAERRSGYGYGRSGFTKRLVQCAHAVPIYVDTGKVHHVGRFKPDAVIRYHGPAIDDPGVGTTIPVDLGDGELQPYVEHTDVARCKLGAPDSR
ncbi:MAG: hypothetical protein JWP01_4273 [Myxococcales bacterium]|nr:hypothetical protein [Myxococcales bacterium]